MIHNQGLKQAGRKNLFLYFKLADNNEAVYPVSALRSVSCSTDSKLDFYFDTSSYTPGTTNSTTDAIRLSITADTEVAIMKDLADLINNNWSKKTNKQIDYVIIGDQIATEYWHANITAVDSITRCS